MLLHVSIITGASKGIGAAAARILLTEGEDNCIVGVARTEGVLRELIEEFGDTRVAFVEGDLNDKSTAQVAVLTAFKLFGQIDSVIASAGLLGPVLTIDKVSIEEWKDTFEVNLFSVVHLVQYALPYMRRGGGGRVVVVSSGAATKPYSGWYAYGSSKAALNHFILTLADNEKDIRAIAVAPGVVDTDMQEEIRSVHAPNMDPAGAQRFIDLFENKELVSPEEPAKVLSRLAFIGWSDELNGKFVRYTDDCLSSYR